MSGLVTLHPQDNVSIAFSDSPTHKRGFKYARLEIPKNKFVYKCGNLIGRASQDIKEGELVHLHNLTSKGLNAKNTSSRLYCPVETNCEVELFYNAANKGYATKKNLIIMSTVSCVNRTVQEISRKLEFLNDESFTVIPLIHGTGCGLVVESEDHINLQRLIKGYSLNNNTFEFILIGLGCEDNKFSQQFKNRINYFDVQEHGESTLIQNVVELGINLSTKLSK